MKVIGLVVLGYLGGLVAVAIGDMISEEVRARLDRLPYAVLRLAIWRLPAELRADIGRDWQNELDHILHRAKLKLYPVTRLITGVRFAAGLLRTAPRIAHSLAFIRGSEQAQPVNAPQLAWARAVVMRTADVALSAVGLLVIAPVFAVIAIAIKLAGGGPVLIREGRIRMLKFRTTVISSGNLDDAVNLHEADGPRRWELYDRRVTPLGRFLRRFALDELPSLWDVFIGKMSLFGSRR